jgi:hypothetical protein
LFAFIGRQYLWPHFSTKAHLLQSNNDIRTADATFRRLNTHWTTSPNFKAHYLNHGRQGKTKGGRGHPLQVSFDFFTIDRVPFVPVSISVNRWLDAFFFIIGILASMGDPCIGS